MTIHKSAEDYLEAMLMLREERGYIRSIDVASMLGVTKPSVSYAVKRLRENGYILTNEHIIDGMDNVTANFEHIIEQLLKMQGVGIEVCGTFLWLDGDTYAHRKEIKELGFRWASKKRRWFLAPEGWRKRGRRELTMTEIRTNYGSQRVEAGRYVKALEG